LEKGRVESIYLITGTTEKEAAMSFLAAAHFFMSKDYTNALRWSLQAKAFHYQPKKDVDNFINFVTPFVQRSR